jgi:hypothetical protein
MIGQARYASVVVIPGLTVRYGVNKAVFALHEEIHTSFSVDNTTDPNNLAHTAKCFMQLQLIHCAE